MKTARIILLFPLALARLISVLIITACTGLTGWLWLRTCGFSPRLQKWTMRSWGKSVLFICGIMVKKNDIPQIAHFILMPNHISYIDIFIVAAYTPAALIGKSELQKWPFLRLGAKLTNSVFVDRSDLQSLLSTMNRIKASVKNEIPVALFPEGTTHKGPYTKPFKNGSFKVASDAGIPVIPMAIYYKDKDDAWVEKDTFIGHFLKQMSKPVTRASVSYGKPVKNNDYSILRKETRKQIDLMIGRLIKER